jgi:hypothetical protein
VTGACSFLVSVSVSHPAKKTEEIKTETKEVKNKADRILNFFILILHRQDGC